MKPLTVLAAMETGRYQPSSVVDTHPGYIRVGQKTLLDPVNYGAMDLTRILTKSSQVGVTKLALDMEPEQLRDVYFRFGLGQDTGTGFLEKVLVCCRASKSGSRLSELILRLVTV